MNRRNYLAAAAAFGIAFASTALVVHAATEQWAHYICKKCGDTGLKFIVQGELKNYQDRQCGKHTHVNGKLTRCEGRIVCTPCSPP